MLFQRMKLIIVIITGLLCIVDYLQSQANGCNPHQRLIKAFCNKLQPCDMGWTCDTSLRDQGRNETALCWYNDWRTRDIECGKRGLYEHPWRFSVPAPLFPGGRCFCCDCPEGKDCKFPGVKRPMMAFYGEELFSKIGRNASIDSNCWLPSEESTRDDWCASPRSILLGFKPFELDPPAKGYPKLYCCA